MGGWTDKKPWLITHYVISTWLLLYGTCTVASVIFNVN